MRTSSTYWTDEVGGNLGEGGLLYDDALAVAFPPSGGLPCLAFVSVLKDFINRIVQAGFLSSSLRTSCCF